MRHQRSPNRRTRQPRIARPKFVSWPKETFQSIDKRFVARRRIERRLVDGREFVSEDPCKELRFVPRVEEKGRVADACARSDFPRRRRVETALPEDFPRGTFDALPPLELSLFA